MSEQDALHALYAEYDFDETRSWRDDVYSLLEDLVETTLRIEDYENCEEEDRPKLESEDRERTFVRLIGFLFMLKEMLDNQKLLLTDERTIRSCINYTWSRIGRQKVEKEEDKLLQEAQKSLTQVPEVPQVKGKKSV